MSRHNSDDLLIAVRLLYAAIEQFDLVTSLALGVDRSALRAINAMEKGAVSPGELGEVLGLSSGSITALLDRLEKAGHIIRNQSEEDRRRRDAHLSKATRKKADKHYRQLASRIERTFSDYSDKDKQKIAAILLDLASAFKP